MEGNYERKLQNEQVGSRKKKIMRAHDCITMIIYCASTRGPIKSVHALDPTCSFYIQL